MKTLEQIIEDYKEYKKYKYPHDEGWDWVKNIPEPSDEEKLEQMDIKIVEKWLRKKKLENINKQK